MIVAVFLLLALAALRPRSAERLALDALIWAATLFCAVAAMHWTASLHLRDPQAPLYAFGVGVLAARTAIALAIDGAVALLSRHHPRSSRTVG